MKPIRYIFLLPMFCAVSLHAQFTLEPILAREALSAAITRAKTDLKPDAQLRGVIFVGINYQGVELKMDSQTGKASGWVYFFHSASLDSNNNLFLVALKIPFLGLQLTPIPESSLPSLPGGIQLGDLNDPWVNSDVALSGARNGGANAFFQAHSDATIALAAIGAVSGQPFWSFQFDSQKDLARLTCIVDGITGASITCTNLVSVEEIPPGKDFVLEQNYPNPVGAGLSTGMTIKFQISDVIYRKDRSARVTLKLYDVLGREVRTLFDDQAFPGNYAAPIEFTSLPAGTYFYRLSTTTQSETKRLVIMK